MPNGLALSRWEGEISRSDVLLGPEAAVGRRPYASPLPSAHVWREARAASERAGTVTPTST